MHDDTGHAGRRADALVLLVEGVAADGEVVQAWLRARGATVTVVSTGRPEVLHPLRFAGISLDLVEQRAAVHGAEVDLAPLQFRMLAYMMANADREVSAEEFRERIFRTTQCAGSSNVRSQIRKLRQRLGGAAELVVTGASGWRLNVASSKGDAPS